MCACLCVVTTPTVRLGIPSIPPGALSVPKGAVRSYTLGSDIHQGMTYDAKTKNLIATVLNQDDPHFNFMESHPDTATQLYHFLFRSNPYDRDLCWSIGAGNVLSMQACTASADQVSLHATVISPWPMNWSSTTSASRRRPFYGCAEQALCKLQLVYDLDSRLVYASWCVIYNQINRFRLKSRLLLHV